MDPPPLSSLSLETEPLTLMRLPTEVLVLIVDELPQKDLLVLARVNKRLQDIAQRSIFETIQIQWGIRAAPRKLSLLLRCIRDKPQRADLVRSLDISPPEALDVADFVFNDARIPTNHLGRGTMDRMVKKLGFDETHQNWVNNAMTGHIGAITTVLLAHLPRLENLDISGPNATMQIMLGLALLNAHTISRETGQDRSTLPFASIKTVFYELDPTDTMLDPWLNYTALSFFFLPRLEYLCVHIPWGSPAVWPSEETPNPTKLEFLRAVVYRKDGLGAKVVEMILKACPALKTLHYNTIWHSNDSSGLDLTEMSSVLRAAVGPIRELFIFAMRVPYSPVQMHSTAFNVVAMVMGPPQLEIEHPETFVTGELSLASMVHVEWLFISWIHLFGLAPDANLPLSRSTFPPEMTKLTIDSTGLMYEDYPYWGHFDRVRKARDFISVCRTYALHLVRIELGYGLFDDHLLGDRIKRDLEHAGKLHGVEVAFSSCCFMTMGYTLGNPGEDEKVPDDWQWLVTDEEVEDGGASDISLD